MKLKRVDTINVIPFIDIMLVLLVIVLTTATFIQTKTVKVDLPKSSSSDAKSKEKPFMMFIKKDGTIYINKEQIDKSLLKERLSGLNPDTSVELYGDQKSNFEDFVYVMQTLKALKHKKLFIVTEQ